MATFDNANVPYPRSSGARFCANGLFLVSFGRSAHLRPLQQNDGYKVGAVQQKSSEQKTFRTINSLFFVEFCSKKLML
jgi:hypothetical protein